MPLKVRLDILIPIVKKACALILFNEWIQGLVDTVQETAVMLSRLSSRLAHRLCHRLKPSLKWRILISDTKLVIFSYRPTFQEVMSNIESVMINSVRDNDMKDLRRNEGYR